MTKGIAISLAVLGIIILIGTIIYQASTGSKALFMVPIGLAVTFFGVFRLVKPNK